MGLLYKNYYWVLSLTIPIGLSLGISIYFFDIFNYNFSTTMEGFNRLISDFKAPIAILAISFPSTAFAISLHKSKQTEKQILLLMNQNNFNNYFKHLEEFSKYISKFKGATRNQTDELFIRGIHFYLFNKSLSGDYRPCKSYIDSDKKIKSEFINKIDEISNDIMKSLNIADRDFLNNGTGKIKTIRTDLKQRYSELYPFWGFDEMNAENLEVFYRYMDFSRNFFSADESRCLDIDYLSKIKNFDRLSERFQRFIEGIDDVKEIFSSG